MLLLSATFPPNVKKISSMDMKENAVFIDVKSDDRAVVPATLRQSVISCETEAMGAHLMHVLKKEFEQKDAKIICFFNTVRMTQLMVSLFNQSPVGPVLPMHSKLSADQRARSMALFQKRNRAVLFTSDVSARGMDYDNVTLVVQFGVASSREQFIHRLGRTARAGKEGRAVLLLSHEEAPFQRRLKVSRME
jgi:ATP-dependent RNA helicase MSS116